MIKKIEDIYIRGYDLDFSFIRNGLIKNFIYMNRKII